MINEEDFKRCVVNMENFIKSKGSTPIGLVVQYISPKLLNKKELVLEITLLRQTTTFIHNVEKPYSMESIIRVPNCLYVRYHGPEEKLQFAYQKLNLIAFEEDIKLKGDSYTVFVDNNIHLCCSEKLFKNL